MIRFYPFVLEKRLYTIAEHIRHTYQKYHIFDDEIVTIVPPTDFPNLLENTSNVNST